MAKRMKFSVVGLPHYTIWHLYEPSVDDIRHMEEMERERLKKEAEDKAKNEQLRKITDQFENPSDQWDKDKSHIRDMAKKEYVAKDQQAKDQQAEPQNGEKPAERPGKKPAEKPAEKKRDPKERLMEV